MAVGVKLDYVELARNIDGTERFGGVASAPGALSQDVARDGLAGVFEIEAGSAEELAIKARFDEVGAGGPRRPLLVAIFKERESFVDG